MLLWDFGDTWVGEHRMLRTPESRPAWPAAWSAVMATHAEGWNVGAVRSPEIFAKLARSDQHPPSTQASGPFSNPWLTGR